MPSSDTPHRPTREERIWAYASMGVNVAVLVAIAFLVPVFRKAAQAYEVPSGYRKMFYVVIALAVGNAIRRIILQWLALRRRGSNAT